MSNRGTEPIATRRARRLVIGITKPLSNQEGTRVNGRQSRPKGESAARTGLVSS